MRKTLDFTDVEEDTKVEYELVPEGVYNVRIMEVEDDETKNGDYMAIIKFKIESAKCKERLLFDRMVITNDRSKPAFKMIGRVKHFLKVIGEPCNEVVEIDTDVWKFKPLSVVVKHREYDGKMYANVVAHEVVQDDVEEDEIPF